MFEIEMLPAREGDCLWIRYGSEKAARQLLVDGGRAATFKSLKPRLVDEAKRGRAFDLLVITHVDRDHIEGTLSLLTDTTLPRGFFREIWFNGYDHLNGGDVESFGAAQGEALTRSLLTRKRLWNTKWRGRAVVIRENRLATKRLAGGMALTLLSPDRTQLEALIPVWEEECREAGLLPGAAARRKELKGLEQFGGGVDVETLAATPFAPDTKEANGSSIALLAEYDGKRALLAADAHPNRLLASVKELAGGKKRLRVHAFKIPHHGSEANLSPELLRAVDCQCYLVSTNGSYFKHPRAVALARILKFGGKKPKTLAFNYSSKFTTIWNDETLKSRYRYEPVYPEKNGNLVVPVR